MMRQTVQLCPFARAGSKTLPENPTRTHPAYANYGEKPPSYQVTLSAFMNSLSISGGGSRPAGSPRPRTRPGAGRVAPSGAGRVGSWLPCRKLPRGPGAEGGGQAATAGGIPSEHTRAGFW